MAEVFLTGIPSAEAFGGVDNVAQTGNLISIPSGEAFGEVRGVETLTLTGIPSAETFGTVGYYHIIQLGAGIESAEEFGILTGTVGFMPTDIPITLAPRALTISERFSSPVIDVNTDPTGALFLDTYDPDAWNIFQDFFLPDDYVRGTTSSDPHGPPMTMTSKIPPLTGLQVLTDVATGWEDAAGLDWMIQYKDTNGNWSTLQTGTTVEAVESGTQVWFSIYFPTPIVITEEILNQRFRFALRGRDPSTTFKEYISYSNPLVINNTEYPVYLPPGNFVHLNVDDVPSVLHRDLNTEKVYYSQEYGITKLYFSFPTPLAAEGVLAYTDTGGGGTLGSGLLGTGALGEGEGTITIGAALNFRLLAGVAEKGTDFLGNTYRNVVDYKPISNADVTDSANNNAFWLSKPNPSQFAVESLYFDVSQSNDLTTIDHIFLDPLTPGVFFNVYYSSDGDPGTDKVSWENKLWTPVNSVFRAQQRMSHPMPSPITGRYVKIEFTKLQPQWYSAGNFQKAVLYDKFPKWVLDYYLLTLDAGTFSPNTEDPFIARTLTLSTDALSLAYSYYLDDLRTLPQTPGELIPSPSDLSTFLQQRGSDADLVDPQTLMRIKTAFQPFTTQPGLQGAVDQLLYLYTAGSSGSVVSDGQFIIPDYPTEQLFEFPQTSDFVSSLERDPLLVEATMPDMKFFIKARHRYRMLTAKLDNDKAYFAGINSIAFLRNDYSVPFDDQMIVEMAGDSDNIQRNDFQHTDNGLVVNND